MGEKKKVSTAEKIERGIRELYNNENRQLLLVVKIQQSNHLKGINYYAALDNEGAEIYQENKSFEQNVIKVDRLNWSEWDSVDVDHYLAKSEFVFKRGSDNWRLVIELKGKDVVRLIRSYTNIQVNDVPRPFYKKILGFRSGKKWKMIIASMAYISIFSAIFSAFGEDNSQSPQSTPVQQSVEANAPKEQPKTKVEPVKAQTQQKVNDTPVSKQDDIPGTIGMTPGQFKDRFNKAASEFKTEFRIKNINIEEGSAQNAFRVQFTKNLGLLGTVNKKDGSIRDVMILGSGDGTAKSGADIVLGMGVLIAAVNPELPPKDRGAILKEVGMTDGKDIWGESKDTVRNGIRYNLNASKDLGIMFSASDAKEK